MPIETPDLIIFLNRNHLFLGLKEEQVQAVAEELKEKIIPENQEIIKQGDPGDQLYLIWSGKVRVTKTGEDQPLATFEAGDYFGEESVIVHHHKWTATVTSMEKTVVLVLAREQIQNLIKLAPGLRSNINATVESHHLARQIHFKWLQPNEVIYFLARKHPILLLQATQWPALIGILAIIGMLTAWYYSLWIPAMATIWYGSLFMGLGAAGWGVWNGLDWGNDY